MGCDGGSIAGRQELVKTTKRVANVHSVRAQARAQVNSCALSQQPLRAPVVACAMGNLFNKDALIEYLLAKQSFPHFSHIQSLKDVVPVTLHWNEAAVAKTKNAGAAVVPAVALPVDESKEGSAAVSAHDLNTEEELLYMCPITSQPSNGLNRFIAMQPCGCVLSERALKTVGAGKLDACLVCQKELLLPASAAASVSAVAGAEAVAAVAPAAATADVAAAAAPAVAASSGSSAVSPFFHPSYLTLYPGAEETLYLRAVQADKLKAREAEKAAKKAAKKLDKAAAAAAAASAGGEAAAGESVAGHKRKEVDGSASSSTAPAAKKSKESGAHARLVASRTGNVLADTVAAITRQAAESVAARRKDDKFNAMFLTQEQIDAQRFDAISTKPSSLMSML